MSECQNVRDEIRWKLIFTFIIKFSNICIRLLSLQFGVVHPAPYADFADNRHTPVLVRGIGRFHMKVRAGSGTVISLQSLGCEGIIACYAPGDDTNPPPPFSLCAAAVTGKPQNASNHRRGLEPIQTDSVSLEFRGKTETRADSLVYTLFLHPGSDLFRTIFTNAC